MNLRRATLAAVSEETDRQACGALLIALGDLGDRRAIPTLARRTPPRSLNWLEEHMGELTRSGV